MQSKGSLLIFLAVLAFPIIALSADHNIFIFYCAFYLETILLKGIAALAMTLQVFFIIKKSQKGSAGFDKNQHKPQILLSSISNISVVLFAILNKLSKLI